MTNESPAAKIVRILSLVAVIFVLGAIKTHGCYPTAPGTWTNYPVKTDSGIKLGSADIKGKSLNLRYGSSYTSWSDYDIHCWTEYADEITSIVYPMDFDAYYDPLWGVKVNPDYCWETMPDAEFTTGPGAKSVSFTGTDGNDTHGLSFLSCDIDAPGSEDIAPISETASVTLVTQELSGTNLNIEPYNGDPANIATVSMNVTPGSVPGGVYYQWWVPEEYIGFGIYVPRNLVFLHDGKSTNTLDLSSRDSYPMKKTSDVDGCPV